MKAAGIRGTAGIAAGALIGIIYGVSVAQSPENRALAAGQQESAASLRARRLRCEYRENPLGVEAVRPRLSWIVTSEERGQKQTAYQIIVASSETNLWRNKGDLWDSGKIASDETLHIPYGGATLRSGQRAWWRVRVWDANGREGESSSPAYWEAGLRTAADWKAQWITVPSAEPETGIAAGARWIWATETDLQNPPAGERFFRRRFDLPADRGFASATLTLTVDDQFTVYVNGSEVGKSSGKTDAWRNPQTFDIRRLLKIGPNVIAVAARNSGGAAGVAGTLRLRYNSGAPFTLNTDRNWKVGLTAEEGWQNLTVGADTWPAAREVARMGQAPWGMPGNSGVGPGRYLRKDFTLSGTVKRARLYSTALGVYEPYLNGRRVGTDVFAPGWTDYRKRVQYQTYDVTRLLQRGKNALALTLADGWYAGHVGLVGRGVYGTTPHACSQLVVEYTDGKTETIVTDGTWKGTTTGAVVTSDMMMGETFDARKIVADWNRPGFDDTKWTPAEVAADITVPREAERGGEVRKQFELPTRKITVPKPGSYIFDLGQNMVGWARLRVKGPSGAKVTLRFAEMLKPDGTLYTTNYRGAKCTDEYILRGDGKEETFEPHFTFRGFRYVEVTGWPEASPTSAKAITGVVLHSETPRIGTMTTSNAMVNQLLENIDWGQRGNFLSVPTDCPQRDERLGWTGDAQIFVRTSTYNRDVASFFHKWLIDLDDAQSAAGAFPDVAPRVIGGEGTAAWGDAGVICPWTCYIAYGDKAFLADHYPAMVKWIEYCRTNSKDLIRPATGYGDWLSIRADTPKDLLATAYFAYSTKLVAQSARILGKKEDAAKYGVLADDIKAAFNRAFVAEDGRLEGNTQTGYLLALSFDLLPAAKRAAAAKYLTDDIAARNTHLSTGFVGVGYLCPTLTDTGYSSVAHRLLLNDTFPSWGYSIKQGATTIWERWDGWTEEKGFQDPGMNSFNHYSFGSVGEWLYGRVAGIDTDPSRPGYRHIVVRPEPGNLTYSRALYDSVRGRIETDWRQERDRFLLTVTIPANTTATIWLPAADAAKVTESGKAISGTDGVTFVRMDSGCAVYSATSGTFRFAARK